MMLHSIIVEQIIDQYVKNLIGIGKEKINDGNFIHEVMQNFPNITQRIDTDHLDICHIIEKSASRCGTRRNKKRFGYQSLSIHYMDYAPRAKFYGSVFKGSND